MTAFDRRRQLVVIPVRLYGPSDSLVRMMAIDTGSSYTVIRPEVAARLGYGTDLPGGVPVTTASGTIRVPRMQVEQIVALDTARERFNILLHPLPVGLRFSGLLGLDFFRGGRLVFDFAGGDVSFEHA